MNSTFDWSKSQQLPFYKILLAFILPSSFAFFGFRYVLPLLVSNGYPKVLMWGIVASVMLFIFVLTGIYLIHKDAKKLNISFFERLCIKKLTAKQWFAFIGIMLLGLIISMGAQHLIKPFMSATGLSIPDYMPFWLDPTVDPLNTDPNILSPGYPLKGNFVVLIVMAITLLLNILAEEIYFRAWLLPKMQSLGSWSWVVNGTFFALYHTFQLWLFPVMLVVSLTTTYVLYKSKSILPAFTIHIVANFLMGIVGVLFLVLG